jgi:hypothetical protein
VIKIGSESSTVCLASFLGRLSWGQMVIRKGIESSTVCLASFSASFSTLPIKGTDFKKNLLDGQVSTRHEIRVAAHFKQQGHELEIVAGADQGANAAKKTETLTNKAHIQSGETGGTIEDKFVEQVDKLAQAIVEARTKEKSFIFAHSDDKPEWMTTINARVDMNNALAKKYGIPDSDNPFKTHMIKDPADPTRRIPNDPLTEEGLLKACADFDPVGDRRFPNSTAQIIHVPIE